MDRRHASHVIHHAASRCRVVSVHATLAALVLAGCGEPAESPQAIAAAAISGWRAQLVQTRADRDRDIATSVTSELAAVERFAPTGPAYLAIENDALRLDEAPSAATRIAFEPAGAGWTWRPTGELTATTPDGARPI